MAFLIIKILGASYLMYLAYKVFRSDSSITFSNETEQKPYGKLFKVGVVMNMLNPKVMLFFLAFFPAFLWNPEDNTATQFFILGGTFMFVSFLVFGTIALLSGQIANLLRDNKNVGVFLKWLQIIVFVGIAVFIFL